MQKRIEYFLAEKYLHKSDDYRKEVNSMNAERKTKKNSNGLQRTLSVIGLILCVIFGLMLLCNLTIIIKGTISPDRPPSVFGITPMVVQSGSMSGDAPDHIEVGDLVFAGKADVEKLKVGDIISFMEGKIVVTHRITAIDTAENGSLVFTTKGDANNAEDSETVAADNVVGIYKGRIPKLGDFAMFLQTPLGMILFVGVPLLAFIIYDIIRRQRSANKDSKKAAEMEAELERLRKLAGEKAETSPDESKAEEEAFEN